ncbi:glycosyltransferase family 2 protein [Polynucleobacter asymbioticus]|uniref:glycosyltransferase family 2 protein n=1 Tax=Polynucleobacter asymbioticus TaxID=576611 RepID=UPI0008F846AF|nr:glycosyltransferase family 2 protein [Polynucleobacter asymbioticus]
MMELTKIEMKPEARTTDMFPKVSIVMPSFNQAEFLERSILSVLNQSYPNVELIVMDGGSTDGSVEIIKKYQDRISYWESGPDRGQAHAINKGLAIATGEWVGWQNSDDIYTEDAIEKLIECAHKNPNAGLVIGDMSMIDAQDKKIRNIRYIRPSYKSILAEGMVLSNQSSLWKRSLHSIVGYLDENLHFNFDYEWFLRLLHNTDAAHTPIVLGSLRVHEQTKTFLNQPEFDRENTLILEGRGTPVFIRNLYKLRRYSIHLLNGQFRHLYEQMQYWLRK